MKIIFLLTFVSNIASAASFYCKLNETHSTGYSEGVVEITETNINFKSGNFKFSSKISDATKNHEILVGVDGKNLTNFNRYTGDFKLMIPVIYNYKCTSKKPLI